MSRFRPTPAGVVATVALVVACSAGSAYAATQITGKDVKDGSLTGKDVKDGSLGLKELAPSARVPGPAGPAGKNGKDAIQPTFRGKGAGFTWSPLTGTQGAQWCLRSTVTAARTAGAPAGASLLDSVLVVTPADSATAALLQTFSWSAQPTSATQFTINACKIERSGVGPAAAPGAVNYIAYPAG